jgi:hypothetical protein
VALTCLSLTSNTSNWVTLTPTSGPPAVVSLTADPDKVRDQQAPVDHAVVLVLSVMLSNNIIIPVINKNIIVILG